MRRAPVHVVPEEDIVDSGRQPILIQDVEQGLQVAVDVSDKNARKLHALDERGLCCKDSPARDKSVGICGRVLAPGGSK